MKKLLILLFSITFSFNSYAKDIKGLFGIDLYDNAEIHVSSNYINSNKFKNQETIEGYFDVVISEKIKTKSPYASFYRIVIDKDNIVHRVYGSDEYKNLEICQAVKKELTSKFTEKYQINFEYFDKTYPSFKTYTDSYYDYSGGFLYVQCRESFSPSYIRLDIFLNSFELGEATREYYDSGL
jgi:hypothetical protein